MATPTAPSTGRGAAPGPAGVVDADLVARLVLGCPAVAALHGGLFGEVATYLPGRRVVGVRIRPGVVEVHVVGHYPVPVADIAAQVRAAIGTAPGELVVDVTVADYARRG